VEDDAREPSGVLLDPNRRVTGHAILPCGQPKEYDAKLLLAVCPSRPSTSVKSYLPSVDSMSSQEIGVKTVLSGMAASRGHSGFMYSKLEELELKSSPPSIKKGLPSTMSCIVTPRFSRCGSFASCAQITMGVVNNAAPRTTTRKCNRTRMVAQFCQILARAVYDTSMVVRLGGESAAVAGVPGKMLSGANAFKPATFKKIRPRITQLSHGWDLVRIGADGPGRVIPIARSMNPDDAIADSWCLFRSRRHAAAKGLNCCL
jgi:hypothetical protein